MLKMHISVLLSLTWTAWVRTSAFFFPSWARIDSWLNAMSIMANEKGRSIKCSVNLVCRHIYNRCYVLFARLPSGKREWLSAAAGRKVGFVRLRTKNCILILARTEQIIYGYIHLGLEWGSSIKTESVPLLSFPPSKGINLIMSFWTLTTWFLQ